jgi:hypothetical protein
VFQFEDPVWVVEGFRQLMQAHRFEAGNHEWVAIYSMPEVAESLGSLHYLVCRVQ